MGFFDQFRREPGAGTNPGMRGPAVGGDPWEAQLRQILDQRYGAGSPQAQQEFDYYRAKRASDEVSGRAGAGLEFPNMDAYWLHRATGTDPQDQPGGGGMGPMSGALANLGSGYLATPWGGSVSMPDPAKMSASPSFQWTMQRGLDALDKSHAARGTILSGGASKDAAEFAAGLASQEYDKDFNRGLAVADFNRGTHWGDTDRIYGRFSGLANLGLGAASSYANNLSSLYQGGAAANAQDAMNRGINWGNLASLGADYGGAFLDDYFKNRTRAPKPGEQLGLPGIP